MIRISCIAPHGHRVTLRIEGHLTEPWQGEVAREIRRWQIRHIQVFLDLGAVTLIDRRGLMLLEQLGRQGIRITACSPLLRDLLNGYSERFKQDVDSDH